MKKNKVTLKDIADMMGMTTATISKALRDGHDISQDTRRKVKKVAADLGYRPNLMARSLVQRRSFMLGIVVPNLRISFFSEVTRGIYEHARSYNYESIVMVNDENPENEKRNLEFLSDLAVDGILIDAVPGQSNTLVFQHLLNQGIPFVAYDRLVDGLDFNSVTIDDEKACFKVVQFMVQKGCKNIAFLGPTEKLYVAKGRYRGYRRGLQHFDLSYDPQKVLPCELDADDADAKMTDLLQSGTPVDAVICVGGLVAFGGGRAILKNGYTIPDDIHLAEFGDNDVVARLGVPFLTVYQNPYQMGETAVDLLIGMIENGEPEETVHQIIETELIYHKIGLDWEKTEL